MNPRDIDQLMIDADNRLMNISSMIDYYEVTDYINRRYSVARRTGQKLIEHRLNNAREVLLYMHHKDEMTNDNYDNNYDDYDDDYADLSTINLNDDEINDRLHIVQYELMKITTFDTETYMKLIMDTELFKGYVNNIRDICNVKSLSFDYEILPDDINQLTNDIQNVRLDSNDKYVKYMLNDRFKGGMNELNNYVNSLSNNYVNSLSNNYVNSLSNMYYIVIIIIVIIIVIITIIRYINRLFRNIQYDETYFM
jgi:hypothetical protein